MENVVRGARAGFLAVWLAAAAGCGGGGVELDVDLKTDLVPGEEFSVVTTTILDGSATGGGRVEETRASVRGDFARGVRVASFGGLDAGRYILRMRLARDTGLLVVERTVRVQISGNYVVTVLVTRDCRGIACPPAGGDATASACVGGRCVSPDCVVEHPESCGVATCSADSDCPAMATCALPRCVAGACFLEPRIDRCAAGEYCSPELGCRARTVDAGPEPPDGGTDAASCAACDDGDPCTDDVCGGTSGCVHQTRDADDDAHGDSACPAAGGVPNDDCNDGDPSVHPGAPDACNGIDDDCTGGPDPGCGCDPGAWQVSMIDPRTNAGEDVSLVAGADGSLHASYYDSAGNDLVYAVHGPGGFWTSSSVDVIGTPSSVDYVRAPDGVEHIAYYEQRSGDLWYARHAPGAATWDLSTVEATNNVGAAPSLALGPGDTVHVSYYDATARDLKHAWRVGAGAWTIEAVDSAGDAGQTSSLSISPDGTLGIAYFDATEDDLEWAEQAPGGAWLRQTIDTTGGTSPSLALDSAGHPHVVYRLQSTHAAVHAARGADGTWTTEPVTAGAELAADRALAVGPGGTLHVAYRIEGSGDLGYVEKLAGSGWAMAVVDASSNDVGMYATIQVGRDASVHIAYHDRSAGQLRYARRSATAFDFEIGDIAANSGRFAALVLDDAGVAFVVHLGGSAAMALRRSWRPRGGIWHRETVDATGNTGQFSDLTVSGTGDVRITYWDATNTAARWAGRNMGSAMWTLETIDNSAQVGRFTSIESDATGADHVAYCDDQNQTARYARRDAAGAWVAEAASGPARMRRGQYTSLTLDADGLPRVLYFDNAANDLALVERDASGSWSVQVSVDATGSAGRFAQSVTDATGGLWAVYGGGSSGSELKAAHRDPAGGWSFTPSLGLAGIDVDETSVALGPDGTVYIAYHDVTVTGCDPTSGICSTRDEVGVQAMGASGTWTSLGPVASAGGAVTTALAWAGGQLFVAYRSGGEALRFARRCP